MATNPLVDQGTLNRLIGSVTIPNYPQLNVTAPYLGKQGISIALQGNQTTFLNTMTGAVVSPEPYQAVLVSIALLKTQSLSGLWKAQTELQTAIGPITVRPDTIAFPSYDFFNCAIESVRELSFSGEDAGYMVTVGGYYAINNALWNFV